MRTYNPDKKINEGGRKVGDMNGVTASRVISNYITPIEEILDKEGNISTRNPLDEVDLYNLQDEADMPEKDAEQILRITYPTRTLQNIVKRTTEKFNPAAGLHDGAHVIGKVTTS